MELDFERTKLKTRKGRFVDERFFEIFLDGKKVMDGIYFAGREEGYKPWFEITFYGKIYQDIINRMFQLLPEEGHVSIEYRLEEETGVDLSKGVPEPITEKGFALFLGGARWFKNWYFSEGFSEGKMKIQGDKTSNKRHIKDLKKEVKAFIKKDGSKNNIKRAKKILKML